MRWPFHVITARQLISARWHFKNLEYAIKIFNTNGAHDAMFTAPTTKSCGSKLEWNVRVFFFSGDDRQGWEKWEMTIDIIKSMKNMRKYERVESEAWDLERRWTELRMNLYRYDMEIKKTETFILILRRLHCFLLSFHFSSLSSNLCLPFFPPAHLDEQKVGSLNTLHAVCLSVEFNMHQAAWHFVVFAQLLHLAAGTLSPGRQSIWTAFVSTPYTPVIRALICPSISYSPLLSAHLSKSVSLMIKMPF